MNQSKSRREFLQQLGAMAALPTFNQSPLGFYLKSLLTGLSYQNKALAQGATNPRRYINIQQSGAPPRWMFDLFLNAYGSNEDAKLNHKMIGTRYIEQNGRYVDVEYKTIKLPGIDVNLPWMWQFSVPAPNGRTRPMRDLLDGMLVLQGIDTGDPGHQGSQRLHFRPNSAIQSLGALSADYSESPLSAINLSASEFLFQSIKGKTAFKLSNDGNLLNKLFDPFISNTSPNLKNLKQSVLKNELDSYNSIINSMMVKESIHNNKILLAQNKTEDLMNGNYSNLNSDWEKLLSKYSDLIYRSLNSVVPGINDKPIGSLDVKSRGDNYNLDAEIVSLEDLRKLTSKDSIRILNLAEHFALTEYVMINKLSYSVTMSPGSIINLNMGESSSGFHSNDEHSTGQMPSLYLNTMIFYSIASCLLELIDQLKAANIWEDTLIDFGGEFNRITRVDSDAKLPILSGTDHGYEGKSVSLLSGAYRGLLVLGNTFLDHPDFSGYLTWGKGANVTQLGRQLQMGDMASTIAYLLRTPSPTERFESLVQFGAQPKTLEPVIEKAMRINFEYSSFL